MVRVRFNLPIVSYQVSGEYAMLKNAINHDYLDNNQAILETLLCFKRAGANAIMTYFAPEAAKLLKQL